MQNRKLWGRIFAHLALLPFIIFAVFPFYHMALTSLKQNRELYDRAANPLLIRQGATLEHYGRLLWETEFVTWTKNSLLVTILATVVSLIIGTIAAYALARLKFFAVGSLGTGIFVTYLVPTSLCSYRWPRSSTGSASATRNGRSWSPIRRSSSRSVRGS
jgi:multiple sugar transport system permease protein